MDEEIDRLVVAVRADTTGFGRDVAALKASLEDGVGSGADRAGRSIESALAKAVVTGKLGFDDLRTAAVKALGEVATTALKSGLTAAAGGSSGGLTGVASTLLTSLLGLPGRATGGPVSPGAAYLVGERGPELFVPTSSGQVMASGSRAGSGDIRLSIAVTAPAGSAPQALARSGRQVARAVRDAVAKAGG